MTRKEKIIEILQMVDKYHYCLDSDIERNADAILALPLDVPITDPCTDDEATTIIKHLGESNAKEFTSLFSRLLIREISCDRCVYRNEHRMCWAIKGPCDISHLKCDYRLDTKLSETPKPR